MKRYNMVVKGVESQLPMRVMRVEDCESSVGKWVKYSDAMEEVQELLGVLKEIINDHFSLRGTVYSARNLMRKAEDIIRKRGE